MGDVKIKTGTLEVTCFRSDIFDVAETHDGVAINFKGCQFIVSDPNMPSSTKQLIRTGILNFPKGKLDVNLKNYIKPVELSIT